MFAGYSTAIAILAALAMPGTTEAQTSMAAKPCETPMVTFAIDSWLQARPGQSEAAWGGFGPNAWEFKLTPEYNTESFLLTKFVEDGAWTDVDRNAWKIEGEYDCTIRAPKGLGSGVCTGVTILKDMIIRGDGKDGVEAKCNKRVVA